MLNDLGNKVLEINDLSLSAEGVDVLSRFLQCKEAYTSIEVCSYIAYHFYNF